MTALVDTSIWSLAFRRESRRLNDEERRLVEEWKSLVTAGRAVLIGPIRQEILSGIRDDNVFRSLLQWLRFFDLIDITVDDYDQAAAFFNTLRAHGVTASPIDALICAVAHRCGIAIFTIDRDFERYSDHVPVKLHR